MRLPVTCRTAAIPRLLTTLAATILLLAFAAPASAGAPAGTVVATSDINVRACPALDCQVLGKAALGEALEITGDAVDGFLPVRWHGVNGYAFSLFVTTGDTAPWFVEGDRSCRRLALVFDIGIGDEPSQQVVDTLVANAVPASMFPMGWWAREHPDFLVSLDAAGFVIGTHGDQPLLLTDTSDERILHDLDTSIRTIESILGRQIDQYATPYAADTDARVREIVSRRGLLPVGWQVSGNDYGPDATEASVYDRVMSGIYPGAVIELHLDGPATARSTALALPRIIADARAGGYEFVTVPDLIMPCAGSSVGD